MIAADTYVKGSVTNDGKNMLHAEIRGSLEDVSYLWALLGGHICQAYNVPVEVLSLSFLKLGRRFAAQKPVDGIKINLSTVERAKEAADHAED